MKIVRYLGLIIFLGALTLFLGIFFMSDHRMTGEMFDQEVKEEHQQLLKPRIDHMFGKKYSSNFAFISDFDAAFTALNDELRAEKKWDKVIYDNYTAQLTKVSSIGLIQTHTLFLFFLTFVAGSIGALMFILPEAKLKGPPGIKNNGIFFNALNNKGWIGIVVGVILIIFYVLLYFYDEYMTNWIILVRPLKQLIVPGGSSSQWFLYGFLYTFAMLVMGVRMIIKYRHSKYQIVRTISVMFFQLAFAFLIPEILVRLNQPYFDFKNMWPLDYDFFDAWHINMLTKAGGLGIFMFAWGISLFVIGVPLITFFWGKRWYCSWVCGCGGLAETAGDPFRQLSDKSLGAWKIERWMVHGVLVFVVIMTAGVLYSFITGSDTIAGFSTYKYLRQPYGFLIGAVFSGIVGVGFYPYMGNRVWCRFGCPLAAYLGLVQRFKSKFRITTNGGQCISCGNCSTYCEMGIDVRWYAQRGQNIIRSSCVGCGVCSAVCPRGVLNLENRDEEGRFGEPILIGQEKITVKS